MVGLAFLAFCSIDSAVCALNDIFDVEAERQHLTKKNRPIASGAVALPAAWWPAYLASCYLLLIRLAYGLLVFMGTAAVICRCWNWRIMGFLFKNHNLTDLLRLDGRVKPFSATD